MSLIDLSLSIVMYGRDHGLLETRRLVLQQAGFSVWTVTRLEDAEKMVAALKTSLLILCHTLSKKERLAALDIGNACLPHAHILLLTGGRADDIKEAYETFHSPDGPRALIAQVRKMVAPRT